MPRPTFLSQIARMRSEMQQKANEIRHNTLIEEANQSLREENLITLTAIITAKAFVNGHVHGPIIKFSDEAYVLKTFPGFGEFYGMVTKYEDPYYEIVFTDGDYEDMTEHELLLLLCQDPVPNWASTHCIMNAKTHEIAQDIKMNGPIYYVSDSDEE